MAYTNVWSDTFPAGTRAANNAAADMQRIRVDLDERMTGFIVVDITADPWVLSDVVAGKTTGIVRLIPFNSFVNYVTPSGIGIVNGYITISSAEPAYAPVPVPVGCKVTQLEWLADGTGVTTPQGSFQKQTFDGSTTNTVINTTNLATSKAVTASAAIAETLTGTDVYWLKASCGAGSLKLYGVRVTFDRDLLAHAS